MLISIVIPNFNGKRLLKKNLPKILKAIKDDIKVKEIIIVDDESMDGSVEYLRNIEKKRHRNIEKKETKSLNLYSTKSLNNNSVPLKIIEIKKNLGFSSTVNRGVQEANGEIIVLLNTDVYPERGFLEAVLPHFNDERVFAVGMMDKSVENSRIVRRGRGIAEWRRGMYVHRRGEVDKTDTAWVSGGSGAFRKSIWKKLGGFDEIYNPFYWEDIDLSYRAKEKGYKLIFEPKAIVIHKHQEGTIKSAYGQNYIKLISYRNQILFIWRNANFSQLISHFLLLPYHFFRTLIKGDGYLFLGFLWAIFRFLKFKK